jgi:hypothetical protein
MTVRKQSEPVALQLPSAQRIGVDNGHKFAAIVFVAPVCAGHADCEMTHCPFQHLKGESVAQPFGL